MRQQQKIFFFENENFVIKIAINIKYENKVTYHVPFQSFFFLYEFQKKSKNIVQVKVNN